jgi:hypothetical protein
MTKLEKFQKDLEIVKEALNELIKKYNVINGITIEIINGKVRAIINAGEIR